VITLLTGLPGHGKTLYALSYVKAQAEREKRPVYYSGIADLKLPWIELDKPEEWHRLPANALVVIDEAQRVFRQRPVGSKVPDHVAALETHRHGGIDVFLITQHPMLLDTNVRRLVGRHFHAVRPFGLARATVHEWGELKENVQSRADSVRHEFAYPKEAFRWYKSAEVHTVKRRIPVRVFMLLLLPVVAVALGYAAVKGLKGNGDSQKAVQGQRTAAGPLVHVNKAVAGRVSTPEYLEARMARVSDLPESAPVYDAIAAPVAFPRVAGCVQSAGRCSCYSQQGTVLVGVSERTCKAFVRHGAFDPYRHSDNREAAPRGTGRSPVEASTPAKGSNQAVQGGA
jgi:zona occludens toxin